MSGIEFLEWKQLLLVDVPEELPRLVEGMTAAATVEGLVEATTKAIQEIDCDGFVLAQASQAREPMSDRAARAIDVRDMSIIGKVEPEWVKRYGERGYAQTDPRVIRARRSLLPFAWEHDALVGKNLTYAEIFDEAKDFGIRSGLVVPLRWNWDTKATGLLFINSSRRLHPRDMMTVPVLGKAMVIAHYLHALMDTMKRSQSETSGNRLAIRAPLTERELSILTMYAKGMQTSQIAHQLHVSRKTVSNDSERFKAKLEAKTISHAVMLAVEQGYLGVVARVPGR